MKNKLPLPPKDWALAILRRSSVTDWPDPIEYARWVRSVAMAGAEGKESYLDSLEREWQDHARGYARRANAPHERPPTKTL
jgi:hypothetical protein